MAEKKTKTEQKEKKLRVTLVKSPIGTQTRQRLTVKALGLRHIRQVIVHPDNPSVRGMIYRVRHLVQVEESD